MNNNFFEQLENKSTSNNKQSDNMIEDKKNIYQVVSIILMVLGVIGSIIVGAETENTLTGFIGIFTSLISGLFAYGFGEIIKQLKLANNHLISIKNKK